MALNYFYASIPLKEGITYDQKRKNNLNMPLYINDIINNFINYNSEYFKNAEGQFG